ncbi:MAG: hypothetical protein IJS49_02135 [Paludibacteraceae bacterium]|nr:hypothetical protein [Paludibacteraceae bacterium]
MRMTAIQMNNLWSYLNGMTLSLANRKWLAEKLLESSIEEKGKTSELDATLAKFHSDWGGNGSAMEIAEDLRHSRINSRTVESW